MTLDPLKVQPWEWAALINGLRPIDEMKPQKEASKAGILPTDLECRKGGRPTSDNAADQSSEN